MARSATPSGFVAALARAGVAALAASGAWRFTVPWILAVGSELLGLDLNDVTTQVDVYLALQA